MKPCRDCGVPTAPSARSCPSSGILNRIGAAFIILAGPLVLLLLAAAAS